MKFLNLFCIMLLFFVACDDTASNPLKEESSSAFSSSVSSSDEKEFSSDARSSSSEKKVFFYSSSSHVELLSSSAMSSSSEGMSSCEAVIESSSQEFLESSSSTESLSSSVEASSSSSEIFLLESSSSSVKASWLNLNPKIHYGEYTDQRDGQIYKTVNIGNQIWFAENLNYATDSSDSATGHLEFGKYYNWAAADTVCPAEWHLPTFDEWKTLAIAVGSFDSAGKYLKSLTGWESSGNGNDQYGFSIVPAGYFNDGGVVKMGEVAAFWSSTETNDKSKAFPWYFFYNSHSATGSSSVNKQLGFSVRCIKD